MRLRKPPPLDTSLEVDRGDGELRLLSDGEVVAEGRAAPSLDLELPELPTMELARASTLRIASEDHAYPSCFVCGPDREPPDGLGVFAGPVEGREDGLIATTWIPDSSLAGEDGVVEDAFAWSVLDCPTGNVAFYRWEGSLLLLGELTASIDGPIKAGEEYMLVAWPLQRDGRKHHTAMAIAGASDEIVARSRANWISV